jgi:hypothetical protein
MTFDFEDLVDKYIKEYGVGTVSRLKFGQRAGLRAFVAWADRQGYHLGQTRGDNGPAIFCAKCTGLVSKSEMTIKPKGEA